MLSNKSILITGGTGCEHIIVGETVDTLLALVKEHVDSF
jgi:hypothetical protein